MPSSLELVKLSLNELKDSLLSHQMRLKRWTWHKHSLQRELRDTMKQEKYYRRLARTTENKIHWEATKHSKLLGFPVEQPREGDEWRDE